MNLFELAFVACPVLGAIQGGRMGSHCGVTGTTVLGAGIGLVGGFAVYVVAILLLAGFMTLFVPRGDPGARPEQAVNSDARPPERG